MLIILGAQICRGLIKQALAQVYRFIVLLIFEVVANGTARLARRPQS